MSAISTRNLRLLIICFFAFPFLLNAQIQIPNTPQAQRYKDLIVADVPSVQMPAIDLDELQREDEEDEAAGLPPRFGKRFNVDLNLDNSGRWDNLPNGGRIWRLAIESQDAISLNFTYSDFFMPKGAQLFIFTEDFTQILGAFSAANNKPDGKFATNLIFDQKVIIGYYEPRASRGQGRIAIDGVVHGYRNINVPEFDKRNFNRVLEENGEFVDVLCAEENWEEEIRSVSVAIVGGGNRWCTGALVANTMRDDRLLFLTANNCLVGLDENADAFDAISNPELPYWVFQWNYQKNLCNGSIPNINSSTTGAVVLANSAPNAQLDGSNFALVELTENPIRAGFDVFFSGWDASGDTPQASTSIHHPNGAPKKISTNDSPLSSSTTNEIEGGTNTETTHWKVTNWNQGEIDNASKGAPLFDPISQNIIGQFSGISNDEQSDHFGQLAYSWLNNGASDRRRRLKDWLDPMNSGVMKFNGVPENNDCSNPESITCDVTVTGDNNNGLANNFTNYSGAPRQHLAKEYIYSFTPNTTGLITIDLRMFSSNLSLFLLSNCNSNSLIASSTNLFTNPENITANVTSGVQYYIVVDGEAASDTSSFELEIGCMEPCESPSPINCGETISGSTFGMQSYYFVHCNLGSSWDGADIAFEFTTDGGPVIIDLATNTDLDLFLLDACDPINNEIGCSIDGDFTEQIDTVLNAGTYYIMIDGFGGAKGSYDLTLNCPTDGTCNAPFFLAGDQLYSGNTADGTNNFEQHGTFSGWDGKELIYEYKPDESGPFVITLSNLSDDVDLFLLGACDPVNNELASSTQSGTTNEEITATLTSGVTYYIMIDGYDGHPATYDLFVETPTACDDTQNVICTALGQPVFGFSGNTMGLDNDYEFHGGDSIRNYIGGEIVYEFITDGGDVVIELTGITGGDLDVFLLSVCDSVQNEIARGDNPTGDEMIMATVAPGTYYIMIDGENEKNVSSPYTLNLRCNRPPILVRLKVSLEGAYETSTNLMTDSFRMQLSTTEPFTDLGFTHNGNSGGGTEEFNPMILVTTGDDAIMDWAFIELRLASAPELGPIATRAALVQRDGDIVDMDGVSPVEFSNIPDDYHIAVRMRNHLGVMTDVPVFVGFD